LEDDAAANQAMAESESKGWFVRERDEFFPFVYSWDSANELEEWIAEEWQDFIALDDETRRATRSAWALADGDARVQLNLKMLITRWRVGEED